MRTQKKNKQIMYYSLQDNITPIYKTDSEGNILYYTDSEGDKIPMRSGEKTLGYSTPIMFEANISNKLTEAKWEDYGVDRSTNYVQIIVNKNELPLKEGSVIWRNSKITYKDDNNTVVDEKSADYIVKGVADEGLYEDLYLLQKVVK